ncbi:hypothetical protein KOR42_06030 [Thalassoglobus neptunius]|uniref:Uncharacterized protein n=1 Tax=Thalassoglobus neptunius TaxID=1938619 RepID=A0A5C5X4W8_9PLAN|nr:hypothetical protein [Thalassoglobus neptunius]TWT57245.1 hypothetical protein KOR42_06030 [Thalassoglobus neptunius]
MPRSNSERLTLLLTTRDAIDDALAASSSSADVVRYRIGDREVQRSRSEALLELERLEDQIADLQLRIHGRMRNNVNLRRST